MARGIDRAANTHLGCKSQQVLGIEWMWEGQGGFQDNSQVPCSDYWMDAG